MSSGEHAALQSANIYTSRWLASDDPVAYGMRRRTSCVSLLTKLPLAAAVVLNFVTHRN